MQAILLLVRRSLRQHLLSTLVTVAAIALASGLVMAVFQINTQAYDAFTGGETGFDAVLGARGSQLQLVLNTVFHLETSPGNIPWSLYEEIRKRPTVELAIPYAVGDNYEGFRVVGTTEELFARFEYRKGQRFKVQPGGKFFDSNKREAVIGSFVAARTGLKPGDAFFPSHGVNPGGVVHENDEYLVVGVLEPSNSPSDRVIWIPIEGIFRMEGHVIRGTGKNYQADPTRQIPDEHKEVSAVMLKFRGGPMAGMQLSQTVNRMGKEATLAWPIGRVMAEFFDKLGWVVRILELVAYLVVAVAIGSILASIYNTMNERRREFAILRALGARRHTVFSAIVAEAASIAALGSLVGYAVGLLIMAGAAWVVRNQTGVYLDIFAYHEVLVATPLAMIGLGAVAGVLPAYRAYRTDVAENLIPHS
jgi:putative ABC transport system permease protein